jgi:iron complex outermembrane receptor protein
VNHGQAEFFKPYAQSQTVYSSDRLKSLETGTPLRASGSEIYGHALTFDMPAGDFGFKYIVAYRELMDDEYQDLGGGKGSLDYRLDTNSYDGPSATMVYGGPTPSVIPRVRQHQFSNELQFNGKLFDETLEFVAGAYAFEEGGGEDGGPMHHILNSKVDPAQLDPLLGALPDELRNAVIQLASPSLVAYWDYDFEIHNKAYALFTQATWSPDALNRRLHATLGLRQSWDSRVAVKNFIQRQYIEGNTPLGPLGAVEIPGAVFGGTDVFVDARGSRKDQDFSPSANLRYDLTDEASVYLSYARAYKSGGFNVRDPQISGASGAASDGTNYGFGFEDGFKPEIVKSWELGLKSEWFGRRLRWNADVFNSNYTDMQTNFLIAGTITDTKSRNVGKARMRGFEMESLFAATESLLLSFDYSYLDAKVQEVIDIEGNNLASLYPFVSAPEHSGTASADWSFLTAPWGTMRASANFNYIGSRHGTIIVEERRGLEHVAGYGTLNARLSASELRVGRGVLEVALWCRNALDRDYVVFAISNTPQADRSVIWGEPRQFGFDLIYHYD